MGITAFFYIVARASESICCLRDLTRDFHVLISVQAQPDWLPQVVSWHCNYCIQEYRPCLLPSKTTTDALCLAHNFVLWYSQNLGDCHRMLVGSLWGNTCNSCSAVAMQLFDHHNNAVGFYGVLHMSYC